MTKTWQEMSTVEKLEAVLPLRKTNPPTSYRKIAKLLGANTAGAVCGLMDRHGMMQRRRYRNTSGIRMELVRKLFAAADNMGLSNRKLASAAGYSERSISDLRCGRHGIKLQTFSDLAEVVGLELYLRPKEATVTPQSQQRLERLSINATHHGSTSNRQLMHQNSGGDARQYDRAAHGRAPDATRLERAD